MPWLTARVHQVAGHTSVQTRKATSLCEGKLSKALALDPRQHCLQPLPLSRALRRVGIARKVTVGLAHRTSILKPVMRDLHAIRTPENVVFELELAGLAARTLGWAVDVLVMLVLFSVAALTCAVFGVVLAGFARALYFVALFAIQWGYGVFLEWRWHGQTVGKRVVGTRVIASDGLAISFGQAALRNLLRVVDILPAVYLLGGASVLLDARARRFGDIAADTLVVRVQRARLSPRAEIPGHAAVEAARDNLFANNDELSHEAQAARAITGAERDVVLRLAARREHLPLPVRYELFAKLARHFEQRLDLRRPAFMSEERFVLNLVAVALPLRAAKRHKHAS